jgi:hypothetical protein
MKASYISLLLFILLTSCSAFPEPKASQTAVSEMHPQLSTTDFGETSTPTVSIPFDNVALPLTSTSEIHGGELNQTPSITPTLSPTITIKPNVNLQAGENGLIWAQVDGHHLYKIYDPEKGLIGVILGDKRCNPPLIPGTTQEICNFNGKLGLLDLLSGEEQNLNIQMPDWVDVSSSGQFLFYGYVNEELSEQEISIYNLPKLMQVKTISSISYLDWPDFLTDLSRGLPSLSGNGDSLVFLKYSSEDLKYYVYEYKIKTNEVQRIYTKNYQFAGGLAWAPTKQFLLLAATNASYDGPDPAANYLFLYNPDNEEDKLLTNPGGDIFYDVFWNSHTRMYDIWSPDSRKVVIFALPQVDNTGQTQEGVKICIITIDSSNIACDPIPIQSQYYPWVGNATWSPDGNYIVFTTNRSSASDGDLIIYSLADHSFRVIDDNPIYVGLYWRK